MRNGVPNLAALQAFEATARLGAFSRAAEELSLTHSAVFRQVAGLEERLGVPLFLRVRRRLVLTEAGVEYAARVRHHLEQLEKDTFGLMARATLGRSLHIAVLPTYATTWLIPRLPAFRTAHPDITLSLSSRPQPFQFGDHPFDAAIYHAEQPWARTHSVSLFNEGELLPVCHPRVLDEAGALGLAAMPHLHLMTRPDAWRAWYRQQGGDTTPQISAGPRYELFSMLLAAVQAGLGVGLVPRFLVEAASRSDAPCAILGPGLVVRERYYFGYPSDVPAVEAVPIFQDWLLQTARQDS